MGRGVIAACMKWVDRRPDVDPLTGEVHTDVRTSGPSDADDAALEWALRIGEAWRLPVVALAAGPAAVEPMLRDAVSTGAERAIRVDLPLDAASDVVAAAIAAAVRDSVEIVFCGAWSVDRGSGSVPAFIAAELDAAQALGLVTMSIPTSETEGRVLAAERRLDRGRRERVRITAPAVLSVEGASARRRRASLDGVLAARSAAIEVVVPPTASAVSGRAAALETVPFRPRPRVLAAPPADMSARERILVLSGALADREPPRVVRLDPSAAADELLAQLQAWGYR
jgi:electron transfer flavoprotein beta subunit